MTTNLRIDTKQLDKIVKNLDVSTEKVIRSIAFEIEAGAKQLAPLMTGALRGSIYTVTKKEDGYEKARSVVHGLNAKAATAPHPKPSGKVIAHVGPCTEYAAYVELGTSKMSARPYLMPAVEREVNKINDGSKWKELFE